MKRSKREILSHINEPITHAKIVDNNTLEIVYSDGTRAVRLHDTDIIRIKDGITTLTSGGWKSVTTKERLNRFCPWLRLSQTKGVWYIKGGSMFFDGMRFDGNGNPLDALQLPDLKGLTAIKKRIKGYCDLITKDNLPTPSSGDCWYCLMTGGQTLGDKTNDHGHLENHIDEKYLHGSILANAMRAKGFDNRQIGIHYQLKLVNTFKRALRVYLQKRLIK
jgi:hypothetical protein